MLEERVSDARDSLCTAIRVLDLQALGDGGGGTIWEGKGRFNPRCDLKAAPQPAMLYLMQK